MKLREHLGITLRALGRWILVQFQDAILVGFLWLAGLWMLDIRLALLWALLATLLQFIPHLGTILSLIGPAFSAALFGDWMKLAYVLILYAVIVMLDGLVLQPLLMKRKTRVPIWASILMPLILGFLLNVWGLLLAPPLLAVIYAYKERQKSLS